jgi:hypothetical protein
MSGLKEAARDYVKMRASLGVQTARCVHLALRLRHVRETTRH